jgi:hypothetical protein
MRLITKQSHSVGSIPPIVVLEGPKQEGQVIFNILLDHLLILNGYTSKSMDLITTQKILVIVLTAYKFHVLELVVK